MAVSRLSPQGMDLGTQSVLCLGWDSPCTAQCLWNNTEGGDLCWWRKCVTVEAKLKSHSEQAIFGCLVDVCHILWYLSCLFAVSMEVQFNKYL